MGLGNSDYGIGLRTYSESNDIDTYHAWGGNYFVYGGSVADTKIHSSYSIDLSETSPLDLGCGRMVPTLP
jgi:hypothetical protein